VKNAQEITKLFGEARRSKRRLSDWMRANHDSLLAELGTGRIDWDPVMQVIKTLGLLDNQGNSPSKDAAYRAWKRVRDVVATERTANVGLPASVTTPNEIAPGVRMLVQRRSLQDSADAGRMPLELHPARASSKASSATLHSFSPASSASAGTPSLVEEAKTQIERVFDTIGANRTPMPKPIR
jgi:hypothetical protein